jgi:integrase
VTGHGGLTIAPAVGTDRLEGWVDYLSTAMDPAWRALEWNPSTGLFTGDTNNPWTKATVCRIPACVSAVEVTNGMCTSCRGAMRAAALPPDEWEATFVPGYRRLPAVDPASMNRDEVPTWAWGTIGRLSRNQFSLAGLQPVVQAEIIYGLQQRDLQHIILAPGVVRRMALLLSPNMETLLELPEEFITALPAVLAGILRGIVLHVQRLDGGFRGTDFTQGDVWSPALIGLMSAPNRQYLASFGTVDFRAIRQVWLRDLVKQYARAIRPSASDLNRIVGCAALASQVLLKLPSGEHPEQLGLAEMSAIVDGFRVSTGSNGRPHSQSHRIALLGHWRRTIEFCRQAGLMDHIPGTFSINPRFHRIVRRQIREDEIGRAIPEHLIAQLDASLGLLAAQSTYHQGGWVAENFGEMYVVIYKLLRDTGRRPNEVVSLRRTCLEWVNDKPTLIWDNHKLGRLGRRLPIHTETATTITTWLERRAALPPTPGAEEWMFPAPGARNRPRDGHIRSQFYVSNMWRQWVDAIPELLDVGLTTDGQPRHIDRVKLTSYGLRHAYAQRHADNGTPVDVLRELMDHRSVETTMGYYTVSLARKRTAIETVSAFTVDRHGTPAPSADPTTYQRDSVSVPFGNCTEPSNVKAGGQLCPIRYQCAGCNFYRPDPSYLTAIESHITALGADRELATATDAATWVISNLQEQIGAFTAVAHAMRDALALLPPREQNEIEEAAAILRRDRAGTRTFIPLATVQRGRD